MSNIRSYPVKTEYSEDQKVIGYDTSQVIAVPVKTIIDSIDQGTPYQELVQLISDLDSAIAVYKTYGLAKTQNLQVDTTVLLYGNPSELDGKGGLYTVKDSESGAGALPLDNGNFLIKLYDSGSTIKIDTAQDIASSGLGIGAFCETTGFSAAGDGGGAKYKIVAGGTGSPDGILFIDLDNGNQAKRLPVDVFYFNTVSEMVSSVYIGLGDYAETKGYYSAGDGGGAKYTIVGSGSGTDDGGYYHDLPASGQAKLIVTSPIDVRAFGAGGGVDDAPAFRLAMRSGMTINGSGNFIFDSSLGAVTGVASSPSVALDGVSNMKLRGSNMTIEMGPNQAENNNNFFTFYVSAESASSGNYSQNNEISGVKFIFNRSPSLSGNVSGVNTTSCENFVLKDCIFDGNGSAPTLAVPGTGGIGNIYENNCFIDISTCFDNSQLQDCKFLRNTLISGSNPVTGFNHFYDTNTLSNIRMSRGLSQTLASANTYTQNEVQGYGNAFSIRGMKDSLIENNHIHSFSANDTTTRNAISIFTGSQEDGIGEQVENIIVRGNRVHDVDNTGGGTTRGIFVNRTRPVGPVIFAENIVKNMPNGIGISQDGDTSNDVVINNIVDESTVSMPYGRNLITINTGAGAGLSPTISSTRDVVLEPAPGDNVRFGTISNISTESVIKYIEIKDMAGTIRKLAVVE